MAAFHPGRYLASFVNYEKNFKLFLDPSSQPVHLERVRKVLNLIDNPHLKLKVIHIAGSKGKGSTAAMIAEIFRKSGYRVGLYTSPHLYDLRERIRILEPLAKTAPLKQGTLFADCVSKTVFRTVLKRLKPTLDAARHDPLWGDLTYFEVLTILAFEIFFQEHVDLVVLETGLGGRCDATNVAAACVSVITPISLEHTALLGSTISAIAKEKAGIIKLSPGEQKPSVVLAPQKISAQNVLLEHCRTLKIRPVRVDLKALKNIRTMALAGPHQRINAATAVTAAMQMQAFGFKLSTTAVQEGLAQTFWPLRFEVLRQQPVCILDAAHNPESCRQLVATLKEQFKDKMPKSLFLIFGASDDKDISGMLKVLTPHFNKIFLATARHARALSWDPKTMTKYFHGRGVKHYASTALACQQALRFSHTQTVIVVCGSLFLAAEARQFFLKKRK